VRRGAAWPTERPSSCLVVGEQEHGWASSVRSLGKEAQEVRTPAVLSSPCPRRCPVRASSVPRVAVQLIGVRCPVRVSERPGVQCPASGLRRPVWASGVRAFQRLLWPTGMVVVRGSEVGSRAAGMAGSGWSPAVSTTARRLREVGPWRSRLAQAVLGQRWVGLDVVVVVGGGSAVAASSAWSTGRGWMREDRPSVGSWRRPRCVVMV
jgi:hypothetical protein